MAAGRLLVPGWARALDSDGDPISARVSLFNTGTDALASVYAHEDLTVPLANPVLSNSAGRFPAIWASSDVTYDWSVEAPFGPPGSPFTGMGLTTALAADVLAAEAAEAAADEAATSAAAAEASYQDALAIQAMGDDAAAIATRAAKAANLSDLASPAAARSNIGSDLAANVNYTPFAASPAIRSTQTKLREQPISPQDSAAATDTLRLEDAVDSAFGGNARVVIPGDTYSANVDAPAIAEFMRGNPISILGVGSGELFVNDAFQTGTLIQAADPSIPVWTLRHYEPEQGMGSVEFGMMRLSGTMNAGVPLFKVEGFQGNNTVHDLMLKQDGAGDGAEFGNLTTSTIRDVGILGSTYPSGPGSPHTGVAFSVLPDQDHALAFVHKITARNFAQAYQLGSDDPSSKKLLGYHLSSCEVSTCTNGMYIAAQNEGTLVENLFVEGTTGWAFKTKGDATVLVSPYAVLDFTTGIEFRGTSGVVVGGFIGHKATGATGITVGAEAAGSTTIFGTELIWGAGGLGGTATGVKIEARADPVVVSLPSYIGSWVGGQKLDDDSYSSLHGGSGGGVGSGLIGLVERETAGGLPLFCLSRGAINLQVDGTALTQASVNGSGTLTLSNASVQFLTCTASPTNIVRFAAPNMPDKTGTLIIDGSAAVRINIDDVYLRGYSIPIICAANERVVIEYQNTFGANGRCWIKNIHRTGRWVYTVAELLTGNAGAPWPGQPYPIIASNGRKAAEGVGAGTGVPVWNDGTTWRTMYDNTVVAA